MNNNRYKLLFLILLLGISVVLFLNIKDKRKLYDKLVKGDIVVLPHRLITTDNKNEFINIKDSGYYYFFFLSPTCNSCKQKIPFVNNFKVDNQRVEVIGIAPSNSSKKAINQFIKTRKIKFPIHIDQHDLFGKFRVTEVPTFFFLKGNEIFLNPQKINNSLSLGQARILNSIKKPKN